MVMQNFFVREEWTVWGEFFLQGAFGVEVFHMLVHLYVELGWEGQFHFFLGVILVAFYPFMGEEDVCVSLCLPNGFGKVIVCIL